MADQPVSILAKLQDEFSEPLEKINSGFELMEERLETVRHGLDKAYDVLSEFVGGLTALQAIERSIDLAEEAVRAEQKLVTALDGRRQKAEEILELGREIQRTTEVQTSTIAEQAALMKRLGVNAELLPRALKASVNTAAALGQPLEAVVRDIALLTRGEGRGFGGRTLKLIPGIKELIDSGADIEGIIDLLERRFPKAAQEVADTDFGRLTQKLHELEDAGEDVGKVFIKLRLAVLEALVPIVRKLADLVDSQQFQNAVDLLKEAVPLVVALAVAMGAAVSVLAGIGSAGVLLTFLSSLISVGTAVAPALTAMAAGALELVTIAGPFVAVAAAIVGAAIFLSTVILALTGQLDDAGETFDAAVTSTKALAAEFGDVVQKVIDGKLEVKDIFDVIRTRVAQVEVLIGGAVETVSTAWNNVTSLITGTLSATVLRAEKIVLTGLDVIQTSVLTAIRFVLSKAQAALNGVNAVFKEIDRVAGTNLAFKEIDLTSLIPEEIAPIRGKLLEITAELESTLKDIPLSLGTAVGNALSRLGVAFGIVAQMGVDLQERLEKSERALLAKRAQTNLQQVQQEREKTDAILEQASRLQSGVNAVSANTELLSDSALDEDSIRQLIRGAGQSVRGELTREITEQLRTMLDRGRIEVEEYIALTKTVRETPITDEVTAVQEQLRAQQELAEETRARLTILDDTIAGQDTLVDTLKQTEGEEANLLKASEKRKKLESDRTELAGQLMDATSAMNDLEQRRQQLLLEQKNVSGDIEKLRLDASDKVVRGLEQQRKELLDQVSDIASLVAAGALAPSQALNAVRGTIEKFKSTVDGAERSLEALLGASQLGPALTAAFNAALLQLKTTGAVDIPISIKLSESEIKFARESISSLTTEVSELPVNSSEAINAALTRTQEGIDQISESLATTRENLVRISDTPGISSDQLTDIRKAIKELDDLIAAGPGTKPQLGILRAIEDEFTQARDAANRELDQLGRDIDRGLALPSDLVARQSQLAGELTVLADNATIALKSIAAASPEAQRAIDELLARLQKRKKDVEPQSLGDGEQFFGGIGTGIEKTIQRFGDLSQAGQQVGNELVSGLTDGLVDVFIRGRESFSEFLRDFVAGIAIMIAKALAFRAVAGALGLSPVPAAASGGLMPSGWPADATRGFLASHPGAHRFAGGTTSVPGPRIRRDIVPAVLTPGEAVITRDSVDYYGRRVMGALLTRSIPRESLNALLGDGPSATAVVGKAAFASGGVTGPASLGRDRGVNSSTVIADEQTMDRLIAGGRNALDRYMRDRRS